jgi:hypothetical protein
VSVRSGGHPLSVEGHRRSFFKARLVAKHIRGEHRALACLRALLAREQEIPPR